MRLSMQLSMQLYRVVQSLGELRERIANQSGQAMVEYSTFTFFILLGGIVGAGTVNFPGTNAPFLVAFMNALTIYLGSLYYWIDLPLP